MQSDLPQVLVVDDEPRALELLARSLRKRARVQTAGSGDEAWELFQHQEFLLVISDQRMPGLSGVDLLTRIADQDDSVGRILLTGYSDLEATVAAINRGRVHAFLHKPCAPPDLLATVKGVLDRVVLARDNARLLSALGERNRELDEVLASLDRAQKRIVASERLAAIGRMTSMIVHDLRSPLTVLSSMRCEIAEVASSQGVGELGSLAEQLGVEVDGLERMCQDLLDSTRVSEGTPSRTREELDGVVASALASWTETASAQGVQVDLQLASEAELDVDEPAMRRAIRNLATNALEAMPDGGTLRVETEREDGMAVIRVSDTGTGIPDEIADKLFEPFVTASKAGGTGLGLAIVQKVVHDHEGTIEVSKPPGGGTAFTLRLPIPTTG